MAAVFRRRFDDLAERRQRVQTRMRLMPPLIDRLDRLKVRLEPPRAHVVRVAVLPADDRTLPANSHRFAMTTQLSSEKPRL